jgi:hypothetical protein
MLVISFQFAGYTANSPPASEEEPQGAGVVSESPTIRELILIGYACAPTQCLPTV